MPGRKLSREERKLLEFWESPPGGFAKPLLRQIRVDSESGLRGIRQVVVPIPYPITAICGRNGVGKSTILALSALSAKAPAGWQAFCGNTRPRRKAGTRKEYIFSDFFHRPSGDQSLHGLRISWISMVRGTEVEVVMEKTPSGWRRVSDAGRQSGPLPWPQREIDFIPASRIAAASEFGAIRSAFMRSSTTTQEALATESIDLLSYVMGRQYYEAEVRFIRGLGLSVCRSEDAYSGFDMGSGEASLISILLRLQTLPSGGLLVIEEAELGLHAEAQERLVEVLIRICAARKIQIILTTHSEIILDRLPRQARVLLRKSAHGHETITSISTRFAVHDMSGAHQPELLIYTEDKFASALVEEALVGEVRARIQIQDIGTNAALARQAVSHLRSNSQIKALTVFDGDCSDEQIRGWIKSEKAERDDLNPSWLKLPADNLTPERWAIRELMLPNWVHGFARELNCSIPLAQTHLNAMAVQLDHHDAAHTLSTRTGLSPNEALRALARSIARTHPALDPLRSMVAESFSDPN